MCKAKLSRCSILFLLVSVLLMPRLGLAQCAKEAAIAIRFMNGYVAHGEALFENRSKQSLESWVAKNPDVSPAFTRALEKKMRKGLQNDPELGWGFDLVLDAQDSPDHGFELSKCSQRNGFVVLRGIDWPEFKVTVRVENRSSGLRVTGAGIVNIPKSEQAPR